MPLPPAVLAALLLTASAVAAPQQGGKPSASDAPSGPPVRFDLRLTRVDQDAASGTAAATPAAPALLAAPTLTTFAGQTAAVNVSGGEPSYSVSLSPTVERADNRQQAGSSAAAPAVRVLWNLRLSGKGLPGGVASVTANGATRVPLAIDDATVAEIALTDPATGRLSRFRLAGRVTTGDAAAAAPAPKP
jgi:hypothetical protein